MSLFQADTTKIQQSIVYFTSLRPQQKALFVSDFIELGKNKEIFDKLTPILEAIQNDIAKYDETTIAQKLYDLGMEDSYAKLLVGNMIKQAPTVEYEINVLSKIPDDKFQKVIPALMNDMWIKQFTKQQLMDEHDISSQMIDVFLNLSRTLMNSLQRRATTEVKLRTVCLENGMSQSKTDILLNTFKINTKFWFDMLVFTNSQDSVFEIRSVRQQNNAILETLKDILKVLKEAKEPSSTRHFQ